MTDALKTDLNLVELKPPPPEALTESFHSASFRPGSLGITLQLSSTSSRCYVYSVNEGSQAVEKDVRTGDELWEVIGGSFLGEGTLTKERWLSLVEELKNAPRPLGLKFRRLHGKSAPQPVPVLDEINAEDNPRETDDAEENLNPTPLDEVEKEIDVDVEDFFRKMRLCEPKEPEHGVVGFFKQLNQGEGRTLAPQDFRGEQGRIPSAYRYLSGKGRRFLRQGVVQVQHNGALWNNSQERHLFLFDDVLVITVHVPSSANEMREEIFEVLNVVDIDTCKLLRCRQELSMGGDEVELPTPSAVGHSPASPSQSQQPKSSSFEIHTPAGDLHCLANTPEECEAWVNCLFGAICACVAGNGPGWRHAYLKGTLFAAVIARDIGQLTNLLGDLIEMEGEASTIAAVNRADEDGYTPLIYACMLRLLPLVKVLFEAGADVRVVDNLGLTPIHWTALQLDDMAMSVLCSRLSSVDILDAKGRTPLYLACVEGKGVTGTTNLSSLRRCLAILLAMNADPDALCISEEKKNTPAQYLAGSWQWGALEALLAAGADCHASGNKDGYNALHYACAVLPLKSAHGEAVSILRGLPPEEAVEAGFDEPLHTQGISTLKVLLRSGARPNAKTEDGLASLYLVYSSKSVWGDEYEEAIGLLTSNGARLDDKNPMSTSVRESCPSIDFDRQQNLYISAPVLDGGPAKLKINCFARSSSAAYPGNSSCESGEEGRDRGLTIIADVSSTQSAKPRSVDNCELCDLKYSIFKRQHHCRLCCRSSCDACSRHRVLVDGSPVRTCDSCYNRATAVVAIASSRNKGSVSPSLTSDREKQELLAGASAIPGCPEEQGGMGSVQATLAEVGDRLHERGEKLERLDDKSAELANAASDFAKLAQQLNQNNSRWF